MDIASFCVLEINKLFWIFYIFRKIYAKFIEDQKKLFDVNYLNIFVCLTSVFNFYIDVQKQIS